MGLFDQFFGDGGVGAANAANSILNRKINSLFKEQLVRNQLGFMESEKRFRQRADDVLGDYDRAEADVRGGARNAKQSVHDQGRRATASMTQGLIGSGLSNSSIAANAQRGVSADVARGLSAVDANQSSLLAGLNQNRAGVRAMVEGDYANLPIAQVQSRGNIVNSFANALGQQGHVAAGNTGGFSSLLGNIAGQIGGSNQFLDLIFGNSN